MTKKRVVIILAAIAALAIAVGLISPYGMSRERMEELREEYPIMRTEMLSDVTIESINNVASYYAIVAFGQSLGNYKYKIHISKIITGDDKVFEGQDLVIHEYEYSKEFDSIKEGTKMVLPIRYHSGDSSSIVVHGIGSFYVVDGCLLSMTDDKMSQSYSGMKLNRFISRLKKLERKPFYPNNPLIDMPF